MYDVNDRLANYGATFFDCSTASRNADGSNIQEYDLSSVDILNLVNPPAASTVVRLSAEVLMFYAYKMVLDAIPPRPRLFVYRTFRKLLSSQNVIFSC